MTPLQKLPKDVGNLGKTIVPAGFEKLPKVKYIAQSGHTGWQVKNMHMVIDDSRNPDFVFLKNTKMFQDGEETFSFLTFCSSILFPVSAANAKKRKKRSQVRFVKTTTYKLVKQYLSL